nr:hypothetical protein [Deltaproteobacteria bacterium]
MRKTGWFIALGLCTGLAASCVESFTALDPSHCNSNDGDVFCEQQHDGARPFCRLGTQACDQAADLDDFDHDGCFAERPEDACYSACGRGISVLDDPDCEGAASTTGTTTEPTGSTSDGTVTDGMTEGSTSTGPMCTSNGQCLDPAAPFCDAMGDCVSCQEMGDPNGACADLDASNPVCDAGSCVECTAAAGACGGQAPVCDENNECTACTEHSQCPQSACH